MDEGVRVAKAELRAWARGVDRASRSSAIVDTLGGWPPLHGVVAVYLAMAAEIDLDGLRHVDRCRLVVPRTEPGNRLTLHDLGGARLVTHPFGFRQPDDGSAPLDVEEIDVVLVPGLAFDAQGNRVGHGAGMYDRLLDELPAGTVRVGIAVEDAIVDRIPAEDHDRRVDWLATEAGVRRTGDPLPEPTERVAAAGIPLGVAAAMVRFPAGTRTSADAAAAVGSELGAIAKSIVFLVDDATPVLVLCSGDRRIDEARLARAMGGARARPAPVGRVHEVTGFEVGGTPAFGHRTAMPVLADASLARYRWVWSAGGTPDTVYPVALDRLIAASGARWADVSRRG